MPQGHRVSRKTPEMKRSRRVGVPRYQFFFELQKLKKLWHPPILQKLTFFFSQDYAGADRDRPDQTTLNRKIFAEQFHSV